MALLNKKEINELADLAEVIKSRRKLLELTQDDLAGMAGISPRSLKAIETGKGNPGFTHIMKILDTLGLKISAEAR